LSSANEHPADRGHAAHVPAAQRVPRAAYFLLFTVSGFAGLIYESLWSQYLKLFLGHAAYAQTLVLALFMGGMAIGSWAASRWSARMPNLLMAYAIAETLIGLASIAFHDVFVFAVDRSYESWLPAVWSAAGESETAAALFKWTLGGALILPQSILLGATFPLMSAGLIRRYPLGPGGSLAMLYFTNSFGAAAGVLASGFLLVELFGLPGTMQLAGAINLVLAAVVALLARGGEPAPRAEQHAASTPVDAPWVTFLAVAFLTGAASFIYEIGWIRMLSLVLGSSTHSFELMLSAFILGLAFGGLWVRGRIDRIADPVRFLGVVQVAMGVLALLTLPLYGQMFDLMHAVMKGLARTDSGYTLFLAASHGIALAIMFPATFCAGMTLPLISYTLLRAGRGERAIGAVYAANTLGAIAGVMFAAHVGMPLLGLKGLVTSGAVIDVLLGLVLLWRVSASTSSSTASSTSSSTSSPTAAPGIQRPGLLRHASLAVAALAFGYVAFGTHLDTYKMASGVFRRGDLYNQDEAKIVYYRDGKTTTVSLMDFPDGRSLRTNGKSDGAIRMDEGARVSDEITMVLTAAVPLAVKPDATDVAVIGIGTGLTTHTLLSHPGLKSVETIEIEPEMARASKLFAPRNANAFADPRGQIIFEDAKTHFSTRNKQYDIIISEPSNPWVSGVSSLFTTEFYRLARRHLKPGGVLVQWFQLYEIDIRLVASVLRAVGGEFPDYVIYAANNGDLLIIAGDPATLARPLADVTATPGLLRELDRVYVHTPGDLDIRRLGGKRTLAPLFASYNTPANSDFHPFLDLHAARYRFLQESAGALTRLDSSGIPVASMLEGRRERTAGEVTFDGENYFDRIEDTRKALYALDFLNLAARGGEPPVPLGILTSFQKDLDVVRTRLVDCVEPDKYDIWLSSAYQLARSVNPALTAAQAAGLWDRILNSRCMQSVPAAFKPWLQLFRAVGARDAAQMAVLSQALLGATSELPRSHREYLVTAGMTGLLATGHKAGAGALYERHLQDVKNSGELDLRLLHAHAFAP
jgi:spermidine synthase